MKTKLLLFGLITLALILTGCQQQAPVAEVAKGPAPAEDLAALKADVMEDYVKAYNAMDATAVATLFADDAVRMPPDAPAIVGRDAIQSGFQADFEALKKAYASVSLTQAVTDAGISGDWGYVQGTYQWTATPAKGVPIVLNGKWLAVAQRQPGGAWKMTRVCWNNDTPVPWAK